MYKENEYCMVCDKELDYIVEYCCSKNNSSCGCMGMPVEPPVCSKECYDIVMDESFEWKKIKRDKAQ